MFSPYCIISVYIVSSSSFILIANISRIVTHSLLVPYLLICLARLLLLRLLFFPGLHTRPIHIVSIRYVFSCNLSLCFLFLKCLFPFFCVFFLSLSPISLPFLFIFSLIYFSSFNLFISLSPFWEFFAGCCSIFFQYFFYFASSPFFPTDCDLLISPLLQSLSSTPPLLFVLAYSEILFILCSFHMNSFGNLFNLLLVYIIFSLSRRLSTSRLHVFGPILIATLIDIFAPASLSINCSGSYMSSFLLLVFYIFSSFYFLLLHQRLFLLTPLLLFCKLPLYVPAILI